VEAVEKHKKVIKVKRDKIALVRDLALLLDCDPDLVADIQEHWNVQDYKLNEIIKEIA